MISRKNVSIFFHHQFVRIYPHHNSLTVHQSRKTDRSSMTNRMYLPENYTIVTLLYPQRNFKTDTQVIKNRLKLLRTLHTYKTNNSHKVYIAHYQRNNTQKYIFLTSTSCYLFCLFLFNMSFIIKHFITVARKLVCNHTEQHLVTNSLHIFNYNIHVHSWQIPICTYLYDSKLQLFFKLTLPTS